jgi:hypothetical protein
VVAHRNRGHVLAAPDAGQDAAFPGRRRRGEGELAGIFHNPRMHTGKGYHTRRRRASRAGVGYQQHAPQPPQPQQHREYRTPREDAEYAGCDIREDAYAEEERQYLAERDLEYLPEEDAALAKTEAWAEARAELEKYIRESGLKSGDYLMAAPAPKIKGHRVRTNPYTNQVSALRAAYRRAYPTATAEDTKKYEAYLARNHERRQRDQWQQKRQLQQQQQFIELQQQQYQHHDQQREDAGDAYSEYWYEEECAREEDEYGGG